MASSVWICAAGLAGASLLGTGLGLAVKRLPHRLNDIFLGFCAGMMLTASIVCLLMPAVEALSPAGWWQVALGLVLGVALMGVIDKVVPHLHHLAGLYDTPEHAALEAQKEQSTHLNRVLMFVIAIAIHKLPEGMATGVVFDGGSEADALAMAVTIALQNIPEGMVVVTPLLLVGVSWWRTALAGVVVAAVEVAGLWLGYCLGALSSALLPLLLSAAAGAMLYVISDEMIPETHAHGYQRAATYALIAGTAVMLFILTLTE